MRRVPTQQQRRTATRTAVIDAALAVFGRDGTLDAPLEQIANEAGVAKGTLLYHFGSRLGLLRAVAVRLIARLEATITAEGADDLGGWIRAVLAAQQGPSGRVLYAIGDELALAGALAESDPGPYLLERLEGLGAADPELVAAAMLQFGRQLAHGSSTTVDLDRFVALLADAARPRSSGPAPLPA